MRPRLGNVDAAANVNGVSEQFFRVRHELYQGVGIDSMQVQSQAQTVVIDANTSGGCSRTRRTWWAR